MVVAVCGECTTDFINVKNVVVVIVFIHSIVETVVIVVTHSGRTVFVKVFVVVNTIIVNVQIKAVLNTVVVVVVNVGVIVTVIDFFFIV